MKLKDVLGYYRDYSGKASDINRQLGFAGIAIIWIFKSSSLAQPLLPKPLVLPALFLSLGLFFDLLHYVVAAIIWKAFHSSKERKGVKVEGEVRASPWLNKPIWALFGIKLIFTFLGYIFIFNFLFKML